MKLLVVISDSEKQENAMKKIVEHPGFGRFYNYLTSGIKTEVKFIVYKESDSLYTMNIKGISGVILYKLGTPDGRIETIKQKKEKFNR